jgi:hypothetical protein
LAEYKRQERLVAQSVETGRLIDEIVSLDVKSTKDFESLTQLYKRIFNFLLFKNKELTPPLQEELSSITSFNLEKEVAAALESVIPRAALGPFVSLTSAEKVTQLIELSNLVIGIRLFNKEIGKGGGSLASLADLVTSSGREITDLLCSEIETTNNLCEEYSNFLQNLDKMRENYDSVDITKWKDELIFLRQYLAYLAIIQEEMEISENTLEAGETKYNKEINELKQLLGNKSSAPKEQVYPKFAILSQAYVQILEEKTLSANRLELFEFLVQSKREIKLTFPTLQVKNIPPPTLSSSLPDISNSSEVIQLLPNTTPDFMQTPLDFLGFCLYSLVKKGGLLIPGQPNLGVYRYKNKHCVFSLSEFVEEFVDNPEKFVKDVMKQCREKPELIHLLRMEENFSDLQFNWREVKKASTKLLFDKEIETPVHFIEKNIDANYCWNEWELRKKAIQLANIRKKQTKASQTILSNFKVDSESQTWLPKEKGTNTGVNKGVNPLRPRNYILGLRDKNV